jgi:hypothetical protein
MNKAEKLYKKSSQKFGDKLFQSCRTGDIEFIKDFANSELAKKYTSPSTIWQMIEESTKHNHIDIVRCIFSSPNLINVVKKEIAFEMCFKTAFAEGYTNIIKCLIEEFDAKLGLYIGARGCINAIRNNHFDIIKYIYEQSNQHELIKREIAFSEMLGTSIESSRFEITRFLIESPKLVDKEGNSYFYSNLKKVFLPQYHNQQEILNFFVFDLKLEKNHFIEEFIKEHPQSEFAHKFNLRELNKDLNSNLEIKENTSKKIKI